MYLFYLYMDKESDLDVNDGFDDSILLRPIWFKMGGFKF